MYFTICCVCLLCVLSVCALVFFVVFFFFFNDTATTEIYTLSLHDALPISPGRPPPAGRPFGSAPPHRRDRKSTRLNSSHLGISYAVFCLKKKKTKTTTEHTPQNHPKRRENHTRQHRRVHHT